MPSRRNLTLQNMLKVFIIFSNLSDTNAVNVALTASLQVCVIFTDLVHWLTESKDESIPKDNSSKSNSDVSNSVLIGGMKKFNGEKSYAEEESVALLDTYGIRQRVIGVQVEDDD